MLEKIFLMHEDVETGNVWLDAWNLILNPPHAITEIFYSLLFDVLLIPIALVIYRRVTHKNITKEVHAEIDRDHGYAHHEGEIIHVKHQCSSTDSTIDIYLDQNGRVSKVVDKSSEN